MALIIKDRVKEITTTTGTGDVSLAGASATFDTFQSVMSNGDTTFYAIVHTASGTDEWEVGVGTWNTGNTLTRTTVYAGSNGTSAVNFSSGNKDIFMTYPASKAAVAGEDVTFADITATDITATGTVTLSGDPTSALQAATKEYVDTIAAAGIHYHTPVRVESPSALTATYDNGTSGVGATLTNSGTQAALVIDGVTLSTSDRVLVYNQTNAAHNGVYTVTNTGSASTNWVLTRATDADSYGASDPDAMGEGDAYFVKEGDTGAGELYVMNTSGVITFGTTAITFTVIAETAVYSAGTGLTLTGTTFSTNQDISTSASPTFNNITVTGTVDGRDVATDGSKLDGIEAGATADQTAAEILTAIKTVDGSGSGLDADTVDGLQASSFLRSDAADTASGTVSFTGEPRFGASYSDPDSGVQRDAKFGDNGIAVLGGIKTDTISITNDGAGSGIDADLLDGQQGSYYLNTGTTFSGDVSGTYNNIVVANDSHTHDGRYYTETEADSRFVNVTGDTMSGTLVVGQIDSGNPSAGTDDIRVSGYGILGNRSTFYVTNPGTVQIGVGSIHNADAAMSFTSSQNTSLKTLYENSNRVFTDGYHPNADKWTTARTLTLSGDASGSVSWDGSANATLSVTVANDSHSHSNYLTSNAADTMSSLLTLSYNGTALLFDGGSENGASYTPTESGTGQTRYFLRFDRTNNASYPYLTNRTPSGDVVIKTGTSAGGSEIERIRFNGGDSTQDIVISNATLKHGSNVYWHAGNDGSGSGLDADLLDGYHLSTTRNAANTVPVRDGNGYLQLGWINTTSGSTTSTINKIYASYDDYVRYITPATLISQLNLSTTSHNHTYNVNDAWLRDNGDNAHVKLYGNSRQMVFRTDGTTEYASSIGGYAFVWMYGGDASGNRRMLLNSSGDLWTSTNGWLSSALSGKLSTTGKAADSELLDGIDSSSFLRSNTNDTASGRVDFSAGITAQTLDIGVTGDRTIQALSSDANFGSYGDLHLQHYGGNLHMLHGGGTAYIDDNIVWHAGNDGSGSGLDADLWDGNQFSSYLNQAVLSTSSPSFAGLNINGNLNAVDNVYVAGNVYHEGDTDTYLEFNVNQIRLITGGSAEVTIDPTGVRLGDSGNAYVQPVSGNYGSFQIDGGAHGGWEGYSIGGRWVFMSNNTDAGIYNDIDNEWMAYFARNGASTLYYNGSTKISTTSTGVTVTGTVAATSYTGDGSSLTGISAGATGGGSDEIFWENGQNVTTNYTITNGKNAMSAGPITINSGVTVTVGSGETWTVV
jgi:hypothetical protein